MDLSTALTSISTSFSSSISTLQGFITGLVPSAIGLVILIAGVGAAVALVRYVVGKL